MLDFTVAGVQSLASASDYHLNSGLFQAFSVSLASSRVSQCNNRTIQPLILDQNYINLKNQVIKAERRVLKELGFCVHVKHPHKIIVTLLQVLECEKNQKLIQTAWNYMNDSLRTDVFVRYQPESIACACIHLSARLFMIPLPTKPAWFSVFNVTEDEINDIAYTILHLYCRKKPDPEKLEREVDELQKAHQEAKLRARGLSANSTPNANMSTFSPASQPNSPKKSPLVSEPKKENGSGSVHSPKHEKESNHHHHHHHHHHHNHVSSSNSSGGSHKRKTTTGRTSPAPVKRSNSSSSPSPKTRKTKTPPRGYKEPLRSRSRSRSRERKEIPVTNVSSKHRSSSSSHKRKRSRSRNRKTDTHNRSPHRHSSKKYYKERNSSRR